MGWARRALIDRWGRAITHSLLMYGQLHTAADIYERYYGADFPKPEWGFYSMGSRVRDSIEQAKRLRMCRGLG